MGLGMILDSAVGMFPHKIGPLLQLLTALLSNKSTVKKVNVNGAHAHTYTHATYLSVNDLLIYFDFLVKGVQLLG